MKLAAVAHELGIPVLYYIAPTIWAWHSSRGNTIRKYVTKVASIFPFEAEAYRKYKCDVEFVGHPLLDIVHPTMTKRRRLRHILELVKRLKRFYSCLAVVNKRFYHCLIQC